MTKFRFLAALASLLSLAACGVHNPINNQAMSSGSIAAVFPTSDERDLLPNIGDRVFFDFNSSLLNPSASLTLARQSAWYAEHPAINILIAGNADERGTETYNLALGQRRADAVSNYLIARGVATSRIKTISYGKDCPVVPGNDPVSLEQNRTVITSVDGFNPQNCR